MTLEQRLALVKARAALRLDGVLVTKATRVLFVNQKNPADNGVRWLKPARDTSE